MDKLKILVLCTGNSCRSQMMEGYLRHFAGGKAMIYSAGVEIHGLNPKAVEVMLEDGVDISGHTSNHISEYQHINFDIVITVCDHARESCPWFPSTSVTLHHNFPDPAKATGNPGEIKNEFRKVRALIREYASALVSDRFPIGL